MIMTDQDLRETISRVIKGVIVIVALMLLRAITGSFLEPSMAYGGLALNAWAGIVISVILIAFVVRLYAPVKALAAFYLTAFMKSRNVPGRDKHLSHVLVLGDRVVLLAFVLIVYQCVTPIVFQLNFAFLHVHNLAALLNVAVLIAVIAVLYWLWTDVQPLIDIFAGKVTDRVSSLSSNLAYVPCQACGAKNDRDALFCVSCGSKMGPATPAATAAVSSTCSCPKCAAENPASAKFCCKCGHAFERAP